jgi:hypothetical protein
MSHAVLEDRAFQRSDVTIHDSFADHVTAQRSSPAGSTDVLLASGDALHDRCDTSSSSVLPVEWAVRLMDRDNSYIDLDFYVEFLAGTAAWPYGTHSHMVSGGHQSSSTCHRWRSQHEDISSSTVTSRSVVVLTLSFASGHIDLQSRPSRLLPETRQFCHGHQRHRIGRPRWHAETARAASLAASQTHDYTSRLSRRVRSCPELHQTAD